MLGLLDPREDDPRSALLRAEVLDRGRSERSTTLSASMTHARSPRDEPLGEAERLGDPTRLLLVRVEEPVDPVLVAVAEQTEELARVRAAGDEHELRDAGVARAPRSPS